MAKKNDKRLCWNCDGYVHFHLERCPYCGVDLTKEGTKSPFAALEERPQGEAKLFAPPYAATTELEVSDEEWNHSLEKQEESPNPEEKRSGNELIALFLLLPGAALFLFALLLIFFSKEGTLHLVWRESYAYFYFLGSVPLLILGWKALNK